MGFFNKLSEKIDSEIWGYFTMNAAEVRERLYSYIDLNDSLIQIIDTLSRNNYEVHLVGGCVRDAFMGKSCSDIDLVTNAIPEEILALFYDRKVKDRGNSFLVVEVDGFEVATYRQDVHNTGKASECKVKRVETIEEDLQRRDFTINAIAFDPIDGRFIDPFRGRADIEDQRIKFVGDPEKRIKESYERIIRACRFCIPMGINFETETFRALRKNVHLIERLANEKIQLEIKKAMKYKEASRFFEALHLIGALKYIFPSLEPCYDQDGGPHHAETVFTHCMEVGDALSTKDWRLKLAGYLHDVGKPPCAEINAETMALRFRDHPVKGAKLVTQELKDLKFSNFTEKFVSNLVLLHMTALKSDFSKKAVKRFLTKLEKKNIDYQSWMKLLIADRKGNYKSKNYSFNEIRDMIKTIRELHMEEKMFSLKDLVVNGRDVIEVTGLDPSPVIGEILQVLFEDCFNNPDHNEREYLLNELLKFRRKDF